jgi:hypothetical protein
MEINTLVKMYMKKFNQNKHMIDFNQITMIDWLEITCYIIYWFF